MVFQASATSRSNEHGSSADAGNGGMDVEFFRACFSRFPEPVVVTDLSSRVIFLNDCARNLTGRAVSAESSTLFSEIVRGRHERESPVEECLKAGALSCLRVLARNRAGDWLPCVISAQSAKTAEEKPLGCVFILRPDPDPSTDMENRALDPVFAGIIDSFPLPFFTVDTGLVITYMNSHMENLTGYSREEVVGRMSCAQVFQAPACKSKNCLLLQAMEKKTSLSRMRGLIHDRQGREIPVAVHCSAITDPQDRVIGGFEALRDITPIVEAEQKARAFVNVMQLIDVMQEGMLMLDEQNRVLYANSKMAEILGRRREDLLDDITGLLPPQLLSIARDMLAKTDQENYQELRLCSTIQPAAGSLQEERVFETCIAVARLARDLITCMYFQDLTKHIEIERELFRANSFLNNIIMSSADGIVVTDMEGNVLIFNEAAERILGYSAEEILNTPGSLFLLSSAETMKENMRRMRSGESGPPGKIVSTRKALVRKDGEEIPVNFSAAIIKKEGREIGSVGIFSDISERLRIRRELEEAKAQLMQAEKIASIGRLAAGIAHEINNPLSGILIFADLLLKEAGEDEQRREDLREIINQTLRCKEIVTRLLNFSRQSQGQRVSFDINDAVRLTTELLAHQALFQDIELAMNLQGDIPLITGDPGQLQQVFTNLVINAATAMAGKGKISISSMFNPESEKVLLIFEDTGPGIHPGIMDKIFEPFFTTKGPGEGTGLGLSVVFGIIQQHGGKIEAANLHSGGASFRIELPLECPEIQIEYT